MIHGGEIVAGYKWTDRCPCGRMFFEMRTYGDDETSFRPTNLEQARLDPKRPTVICAGGHKLDALAVRVQDGREPTVLLPR